MRYNHGFVDACRERVRQRLLQPLNGIDVLREYSGRESSVFANAAAELGVHSVVMDSNTLDLSIKAHVEQILRSG